MYCQWCGERLIEGDNNAVHVCGSKDRPPAYCMNCGAALLANAKFCTKCAMPVGVAPFRPTSVPATTVPPFQFHASEAVTNSQALSWSMTEPAPQADVVVPKDNHSHATKFGVASIVVGVGTVCSLPLLWHHLPVALIVALTGGVVAVVLGHFGGGHVRPGYGRRGWRRYEPPLRELGPRPAVIGQVIGWLLCQGVFVAMLLIVVGAALGAAQNHHH
jgi:hypothetical protein